MTRPRPHHLVGPVADTPAEIPTAPAATVTVYPDGPLVVRGDFAVRGLDGSEIDAGGGPVALCRCGRSAVKPLCDGSHKLARRRGIQQASAAAGAPTESASTS